MKPNPEIKLARRMKMPKKLTDLSPAKLLVSPSMLAADAARLGDAVRALKNAGAELVHWDIMDGHFVPNLAYGPGTVAGIRKVTDLPFDVHLMLSEPQKYIPSFVRAGADHITVHIESEGDALETVRQIHAAGCTAGITLKPGTPAESVFPVLPEVEMVLVMTVEPGFGGQSFMHGQMEKVRKIRAELRRIGKVCHIEVDGGLDASTVAEAAAAGANIIVAGTAVFKHRSGISTAVAELHDAERFMPV